MKEFLFFLVIVVPGVEPKPAQIPMDTAQECVEQVEKVMSAEVSVTGDLPRGALIDARCIRRIPPITLN